MSDTEFSEDRDLAPAVSRSIKVLQYLADSWGEPQPLSELARAIGAAKSSTSNLCKVLERSGMIRRTSQGYTLGARTVEFGAAYLRTVEPVREFYRYCDDSQYLIDEVVQVAMLEGTDVIYLARHEGRAPLRLSANIGDRFPAAPTAIGNALLAQLPVAEVEARFSTPGAFPQRTRNSTASLTELLEKLELVRERGYAVDDNEVHPGIYGLAVYIPPRSSISSPLAIGASLMSEGMTEHSRDHVLNELRELAALMTNPLRPDPASPHSHPSTQEQP